MTFFMPMIPPTVTAQQHRITVRNGKPLIYDSPALSDARQKLLAHLSRHKPDAPMIGAVRLLVKWCFPSDKHHASGEYRITKPDTDNLQKLLKDCMTVCRYWHDDAQVASETVEKFWADIPGIFIDVDVIENE